MPRWAEALGLAGLIGLLVIAYALALPLLFLHVGALLTYIAINESIGWKQRRAT